MTTNNKKETSAVLAVFFKNTFNETRQINLNEDNIKHLKDLVATMVAGGRLEFKDAQEGKKYDSILVYSSPEELARRKAFVENRSKSTDSI